MPQTPEATSIEYFLGTVSHLRSISFVSATHKSIKLVTIVHKITWKLLKRNLMLELSIILMQTSWNGITDKNESQKTNIYSYSQLKL